MDNKIKIIVVDDHKIFRESLSFMLSKSKSFEILAEAGNGEEFIALLDEHNPDIVLMDINMPVMDGIEATKKAVSKKPSLKVIALSMNGDENYYYQMIHAGGKGFVQKQAGSEELEEAIYTVMKGNDFFSPGLLKNIIINLEKKKNEADSNLKKNIQLTDRENEILQLVCTGESIKYIAQKLFISPRTVEGHKAKIMEKLGANNSNNLIILAIKYKLIEI